MKYVAYVRRSSEDKTKQIQSISKQYEWIAQEAERRGIVIDKYFEDTKSAKSPGREGFNAMMQHIYDSLKPIGIICWRTSRLSRNPVDEGAIKYGLIEKQIGNIIAGDREHNGSTNHILLGVDFGQATQYSLDLGKDVSEGMDKKVKKGWLPGRVPYGYKNDPYGLKGEKKVYTDDKYFKPIQSFLRLFLTGAYSIPELQEKMTNEWGLKNKQNKPFAISTLYRILNTKFYSGYFDWKGELIKGAHKPMITPQEYEAIQAMINGSKRITPTQNKGRNYFSGFITCRCCGSMITGYTKEKIIKSTGKQTQYHYLKCTKAKDKRCQQKPIRRKVADRQMKEILESIHISQKVLEFMFKKLEKENKEQEKSSAKEREILQKKFNQLECDLDELTKKLIRGVIDDECYKRLKNELSQDKAKVMQQIESYNEKREDWIKNIRETFEFANLAPIKYEHGNLETKKMILRTVGSNFFLNDGKLEIELAPAFSIIQSTLNKARTQNSRIEPKKSQLKTDLNTALADEVSIWSA